MSPTTVANRPFTDAYLMAYSGEHIQYEVNMFFEGVELRSRPGYTENNLMQLGDPRRINNALIESFVVHLRNLIDFLYLPAQGTDVVAEDFFPAGTWVAIRPPKTQMLIDAKSHANKEISHLTTARISGTSPEKAWDFVGLALELRLLLILFSQKADKARLAAVEERTIR